MSRQPLNVKKLECSGEPVPFKFDVISYFILSAVIASIIFIAFDIGLNILDDPFLKPEHKFLILLGIYAISDLISGYIASFPISKIVSKSYDTCYFVAWYSERTRNILRNLLNWLFNALIYVYGIIEGLMALYGGAFTIEMKLAWYFIIRLVSALFAYLLSKYMMELRMNVTHAPK